MDVKLNTKVMDPVQLSDGRQEISLSGGSKLVVDMYIPTYGVQPNSAYVPAQFLDDRGFVKVDEYLHVKDAEGVYAIGDVSNADPPQFYFVDKQAGHIAKNMILTLSNKLPIPYKIATSGM